MPGSTAHSGVSEFVGLVPNSSSCNSPRPGFAAQVNTGARLAARQRNLLDEIFERSIKTYSELRYCTRFLRREVELDAVLVSIEVWNNEWAPAWKGRYRLAEEAFPNLPAVSICAAQCDNMNGSALAAHILGAASA